MDMNDLKLSLQMRMSTKSAFLQGLNLASLFVSQLLVGAHLISLAGEKRESQVATGPLYYPT
jgi:hypothetical protein